MNPLIKQDVKIYRVNQSTISTADEIIQQNNTTLIFQGVRRIVNFPASYSTRFNPVGSGDYMKQDSNNFLLYLEVGDPDIDLERNEYKVVWSNREGKIKQVIVKNAIILKQDREILIQPYG